MKYFLSKSDLKVLFHHLNRGYILVLVIQSGAMLTSCKKNLTVYEFDPIASTYMRKWYELPIENPRRDNMILAHLHRDVAWVIEQSHILKSQWARKQLGIISTDLSPKLALEYLVNCRLVSTETVLPCIPTTLMVHYVFLLISKENLEMPSPFYQTLILLQQYSLC